MVHMGNTSEEWVADDDNNEVVVAPPALHQSVTMPLPHDVLPRVVVPYDDLMEVASIPPPFPHRHLPVLHP